MPAGKRGAVERAPSRSVDSQRAEDVYLYARGPARTADDTMAARCARPRACALLLLLSSWLAHASISPPTNCFLEKATDLFLGALEYRLCGELFPPGSAVFDTGTPFALFGEGSPPPPPTVSVGPELFIVPLLNASTCITLRSRALCARGAQNVTARISSRLAPYFALTSIVTSTRNSGMSGCVVSSPM